MRYSRSYFCHLLITLSLGQRLYTRGDKASLETMDRQIYRLIGKATTLAAWVQIIRQLVGDIDDSSGSQDGLPCPPRKRLCDASDWAQLHRLVSNSLVVFASPPLRVWWWPLCRYCLPHTSDRAEAALRRESARALS